MDNEEWVQHLLQEIERHEEEAARLKREVALLEAKMRAEVDE
jgi:hypothetical protein